MKPVSRQLYLLAGMWFSVVALAMAISLLIPSESAKGNFAAPFFAREIAASSSPVSSEMKEGKKMLIANLEDMRLSLYEGAKLVKTFPILSRGKEGTPWETPVGKYVIQNKEEKHFSSIGGVWMPYSMQFYGNFFIHGWPTHPDGRDVPIGYSGGCIRLSTSDAREVYEFALPGTRLVVEGGISKEAFSTSSRYYLRGKGAPPELSAEAFLAADLLLGVVLSERSATALHAPGNLRSLMTALTAIETIDQYKIVRMSELLFGRSVLRRVSTHAADELAVGSLVYPLLFGGNDTAAKVFSREHGEKQFVKYMNEKSAAIGMQTTQWEGALSSDPATSTAQDLFTLIRYIDNNKHFLMDVTLAKERVLFDNNGKERYRWENKNPWIIGGDARYRGGVSDIEEDGGGNALLLFELPVAEFGTRTIALVLLHSKNVTEDVERLREFLSAHFVYGVTRENGNGNEAPRFPQPQKL